MTTDESSQRALVVAEARRWIGTPYHSNADILGAGVDCGMLAVRAYVDAGLVPTFDPRPYSQDWHLHRSEERYLGFITSRLHRVETPGLGDIVVFRYGRCYSHGAIVTALDPLTIIHAFIQHGQVVEERLASNRDLTKPGRDPRTYSLWSSI